MTMGKFLTAAFFDPIFSEDVQFNGITPLSRYLRTCDVTSLSVRALESARADGRIGCFSDLSGHDYPIARHWNDFARGLDASGNAKFAAAEIITQQVHNIVAIDLFLKNAKPGADLSHVDVSKMRQDIPTLVTKLNAFFHNPCMNDDLGKIQVCAVGDCYLVQLVDWQPVLLIGPNGQDWSVAADRLRTSDEHQPSF